MKGLTGLSFSFAAAVLLSGCVAHCPCDVPDNRFPAFVENRERFDDPPATTGKIVYIFRSDHRHGTGAPILLLHEYPALNAECLEFAHRLANEGFTVYVPVLFGNQNGQTGFGDDLATIVELGFSPDWNVVIGEHEHSPITDWLRQLCRDISSRSHQKIGVIGMCLTGSFPLALMSEKCVAAPVVCQPATPLFALTPEARRAIGISNPELKAGIAAAQSEGKKVFFTRYALDQISNPQRAQNIKAQLGSLMIDRTIPEKDYAIYQLQQDSHATMTQCNQTRPARRLFRELVAYLHERLD